MERQLSTESENRQARWVSLTHLTPAEWHALPEAFCAFLDAAGTATARPTFYNTADKQRQAMDRLHEDLSALDRGIYAAALLLPGITDHTRQLGLQRLVSTPRNRPAVLSEMQEKAVLRCICADLPPQRMLNVFADLRTARVNNARTRKLILGVLLGDKRLEFWSVKYRRKLAAALQHAWGKRTAGILRSILAKPGDMRDEKERRILSKEIGRFLVDGADRSNVEECVSFILGNKDRLTLPRLQAYEAAKLDLAQGKTLPYEVLEGIRSRFHRNVSHAQVLELTKSQLTTSQRMALQRAARRSGVAVEFDPANYSAERLYLYAFEMGLTEEIRLELRRKARAAADQSPVRFQHVAVLLDTSASMIGHDKQKRRPIAIALATRDMLCALTDRATVIADSGGVAPACELVEPGGDTSLAWGLAYLLGRGPDAVFVLSDGYENAPAGRMAEVVHAARRLGCAIPICQVSPVFAAEAGGLRLLCDEIPAMPISKPQGVGLALLKAMFESDVERAVGALLRMTLPVLEPLVSKLLRNEGTADVW
ncbi:MAG: VWA domain-containing protein [Phycisphaerales bacterium]|nr:MAG: VWA domain-containing protein [Phycisphaerales bacterium]